MNKKLAASMVVAVAVGLVGLGVAPANAAGVCSPGNLCSWDSDNFGGTMWSGAAGSNINFVDVIDDRTNSTHNDSSAAYNAQNNTAFAQEQTIRYIGAGGKVATYSGDNNKIDHYRKA